MSSFPTERAAFLVRPAAWPQDEPALRRIREEVFVQEQHVPVELEWDGTDVDCLHILAYAGDEPVGTARMTLSGHIGRMAVRAAWRGRGIGSAMLEVLVETARARGLTEVYLNAQVSALIFYQGHSFWAEGGVFLDAGIPHRHMRRGLVPNR
jgi:predicted GNAT family N-acyltransferase